MLSLKQISNLVAIVFNGLVFFPNYSDIHQIQQRKLRQAFYKEKNLNGYASSISRNT